MSTRERDFRRQFTLADFAFEIASPGGFEQPRPSDLGPACRAFAEQIQKRGDLPQDRSREIADDTLASYLATLVQYYMMRGGDLLDVVFRSSILVVVADQQSPKYVLLVEDARRTWAQGEGPTLRPLDLSFVLGQFPFILGIPRNVFDCLLEILKVWKRFPVIFMPPLPRLPTAKTLSPPGEGVYIGGGATADASCGVLAVRNQSQVLTTVAHAVGSRTSVTCQGITCNVIDIDYVTDAALIDAQGLTVSTHQSVSPLRSTPSTTQLHSFQGCFSATSDNIVGWDPTLVLVNLTFPVQLHVYTGGCTQPGDSGAALVDPNNRVVGFAQFTGSGSFPSPQAVSQFPGFSAWVWANSVFTRLMIK